jgi:hypothetical protein
MCEVLIHLVQLEVKMTRSTAFHGAKNEFVLFFLRVEPILCGVHGLSADFPMKHLSLEAFV